MHQPAQVPCNRKCDKRYGDRHGYYGGRPALNCPIRTLDSLQSDIGHNAWWHYAEVLYDHGGGTPELQKLRKKHDSYAWEHSG
jgi:hypothetical protein